MLIMDKFSVNYDPLLRENKTIPSFLQFLCFSSDNDVLESKCLGYVFFAKKNRETKIRLKCQKNNEEQALTHTHIFCSNLE